MVLVFIPTVHIFPELLLIYVSRVVNGDLDNAAAQVSENLGGVQADFEAWVIHNAGVVWGGGEMIIFFND